MTDTLAHLILTAVTVAALTVLCALGKASADVIVPVIAALAGVSGGALVVGKASGGGSPPAAPTVPAAAPSRQN